MGKFIKTYLIILTCAIVFLLTNPLETSAHEFALICGNVDLGVCTDEEDFAIKLTLDFMDMGDKDSDHPSINKVHSFKYDDVAGWENVEDQLDATIVSDTIPSNRADWLKDKEMGVLTLHGYNHDEFQLAQFGTWAFAGSTDVRLKLYPHFITQDFASAWIKFSTSSKGHMVGWSNDVKPLAIVDDGLWDKARVLVVNQDEILSDDSIAAENRAFFGAFKFEELTTEGKELFDRTLTFVSQEKEIEEMDVVLVCQTSSCDTVFDPPILQYLNDRVKSVTPKDDNLNDWLPDVTGSIDAIVISPSVVSGNTLWLKEQREGILTLEHDNYDEFGLGTGGDNINTGITEVVIFDNSHEITDIYGAAHLKFSESERSYMSNWPTEVTPIAVADGNEGNWGKARILIADKGDKLYDETIAAERRVFFGARDWKDLTPQGMDLFKRSVQWVSHSPLTDPTFVDVSFKKDENLLDHASQVKILDGSKVGDGNGCNPPSICIFMISSDTNPSGVVVPIVEDGDTGIFSGEVILSTDPDPGQIEVSLNDEITAQYTNELGTISNTAIVTTSSIPFVTEDKRPDSVPPPDCDDFGLDLDSDFICDDWEDPSFDGGEGPGLYVTFLDDTKTYFYPCDPECSPNTRDIFIEIDWMEGHKPDPDAIQALKEAFSRAPSEDGKPFNLHIQVDEAAVPHMDFFKFPGDNLEGEEGYDQIKAAWFGTSSERDRFPTDGVIDEWWNSTGWKQKKAVFHYGLFVHRQEVVSEAQTVDDSSGIGEVLGNDFMISLGSYAGNLGSTQEQAGTLMHEIGHNLGLEHGGGDTTNCKPNYLSVMSYSRQMTDLLDDRPLDYSRSNLLPVSEGNLNEPIGVGNSEPDGLRTVWGPMTASHRIGGALDWNDDGDTDDSGFEQDLNSLPGCDGSGGSLNPFDDWNNIRFDFVDHTNYADGISTNTNPDNFLEGDDFREIRGGVSPSSNLQKTDGNEWEIPIGNYSMKIRTGESNELRMENLRDSRILRIDYLETLLNKLFDPVSDSSKSQEFITKWGSAGVGPGQLHIVTDIEIDSEDNIYVADSGNSRIVKFSKTGDFIMMWGSKGSENGQFERGDYLTVDSQNNVYVSDLDNNRVQKFDSNGNFIDKWDLGKGIIPLSIATDSLDNVYFSAGNEIYKYSSSGKFLKSWNPKDDEGNPSSWWGMHIDSSDNFYGVDPLNNNVVKFSNEGEFITKWDAQVKDNDQLGIQGISVDSLGNIYVAYIDGTHKVNKFDSSGKILQSLGIENTESKLLWPRGIAIDTDGSIYVAEQNEISVFGWKSKYHETLELVRFFLQNDKVAEANLVLFDLRNDLISDFKTKNSQFYDETYYDFYEDVIKNLDSITRSNVQATDVKFNEFHGPGKDDVGLTNTIIINKGISNTDCQIENTCFEPFVTWIPPQTSVTWKNDDSQIHKIKCSLRESEGEISFETQEIEPDGSYFSNIDDLGVNEGLFECVALGFPEKIGFIAISSKAIPEFGGMSTIILIIIFAMVVLASRVKLIDGNFIRKI